MTDEKEIAQEEVLNKAKMLGYDPDRYARDDSRWKSPEDFIAFGEQLNPILRENNKRLEKANQELQEQIKQIQVDVKKFAALHEATEKEAYAKALADLKTRKVQALQEQDFEAVVEVDEQIVATKAAQQAAAKPAEKTPVASPAMDAYYAEFLKNNPWADKRSNEYNEDMEAFALSVGAIRVSKGLVRTDDDFKVHLEAVADKVKERFPEKFDKDVRTRAPMVEGGGDGGVGKPVGKRTYSNLPKTAQESCDFLCKTIKGYTREKYLSNYDWDKGAR